MGIGPSWSLPFGRNADAQPRVNDPIRPTAKNGTKVHVSEGPDSTKPNRAILRSGKARVRYGYGLSIHSVDVAYDEDSCSLHGNKRKCGVMIDSHQVTCQGTIPSP